jgi:CRISPR-associated endonuclease/helicase Cas3
MIKEFYSHIDRLLKDHLKNVGKEAGRMLDHPALPARILLSKAAYFTGLSHDLGKFTSYFQRHLNGERVESKMSNHAFVSAVMGGYITIKRLGEFPDMPERKFIPLLSFLAIHRHHGNLKDPRELLPRTRKCLNKWPEDIKRLDNKFYGPFRAMEAQLRDFCNNWDNIYGDLKELGIAVEVEEFIKKQPVVEVFTELEKIYFELERLHREDERMAARLCLWGQLLFSALVDADKFSAANVERLQRGYLQEDLVERYIVQNFPKPRHELDKLRSEFHKGVREKVKQLLQGNDDWHLLSITASTGMGKTFAALDAALRIRNALEGKWGKDYVPRIIYALPFINIIEQNYEEYHKVLSSQLGQEYKSSPERYLLRHHYLAEVSYSSDNEKKPVEEALLLTESWESEIVVTTFVQVFQTIIGYRNKFLKKLHNLIGAIVILDEVQSLPVEYWDLTNKIFQILCDEMGLIILQITATQPMIFSKSSMRELYTNYKRLFEYQNRTVLNVDLKEKSGDMWAEWVLELYGRHSSVMVVVNTIRSSIDLYKKIKERVEGFGVEPYKLSAPSNNEWLVYLSTNITPDQRRKRLKDLKNLLKNNCGRAILISTQVVEAGVDIDFPSVVREIGPFDSIVQVSGRCNREGQRDMGFVYVGCFENGQASHVYGGVHITAARNILKGIEKKYPEGINEKNYMEIVEKYFNIVKENSSKEQSQKLWSAYIKLIYDSLEQGALSEFELLEHLEQIPVCVPLTAEDEEWLLEVYAKEVLSEQKPFTERRLAAIKFKKRFHDMTIRPLLCRAVNNLSISLNKSGSIRWIPIRDREFFYDIEYGFKWLPEDKSVWCL